MSRTHESLAHISSNVVMVIRKHTGEYGLQKGIGLVRFQIAGTHVYRCFRLRKTELRSDP